MEPKMIKLLKLASYLAIALAISTVVFAGIGLTRENETVRDRGDFLDKPTVIEKIRDLEKLPDTRNKVSPLVTEAIDFALRIDPLIISTPVRDPRKTHDPRTGKPLPPDAIETQVVAPPIGVKFDLVATCRYENFPEKSLAMVDIVSKGFKWVRQGQMLGHHEIHEIKDGSVIVDQNGKFSGTLLVPKKSTVSSLLKGNGEMTSASIAASAATKMTSGQPVKRSPYSRVNRKSTPASSAYRRQTSSIRPNTRKLPAKPLTEEAKKAAAKNEAELTNILNDIGEAKPGSPELKDQLNMEALLRMLDSANTNKPKPKKK